ncbi:MAG: multidrug effflux MFS transporter [Alphaproteobacteria bacterium]|nr:multidrug effflux MFS transporter [Rhodospirillaceae bacterium]MBT7648319.1 multidrug effflux MFS transporter [Rhodospirillaceae bacterium]MDG2482110.1 multidrug effflux MFS transporter [Alphaproteobacteria bacterium]
MSAKQGPSVFVVCVVITGLIALAPMSTDIAIPALPAIGRALEATPGQVGMIVGLFALGVGLMQLVYGPLSDRFGRRPVLMAALVLYIASTIGIVLATSIEMLITLRVFQAAGACAGTVLGRAVVRDMFERDQSGRVLGYVMTAMTLVPGFGPIIGGELLVAFGWRSVFLLILGVGIVISFAAWRLLPETLDETKRQPAHVATILRHFGAMLRNRVFLGFTIALCASFIGLFGYIAGAGYTYVEVFKVAENHVGWLILLAVAGYITGGFTGSRCQRRFGLERIVLTGMVLNVAGGMAMLICLVVGLHNMWAVALPAAIVFAGCGAALPQATAGALGPFPHVAGTASSLVGVLQMMTGAAAAASIGYAYDGSHGPMVIAMASGPLVGLVLYVWLIRPFKRRGA